MIDPTLGFPSFEYQGLVLKAGGLKYAPHSDIIFPSVIRTCGHIEKPLGKYYMYYAPHDAPGGICLAYADSPEGPWIEYDANPLITHIWGTHYSVSHVSSPHALWNEDENCLFLYYHGENAETRYAVSHDGIHFEYGGVAVTTDMIKPELREFSYARVFRHDHGEGMRYAMIVVGNDEGTRNLYLASSVDGREWQARIEPFVTPPPGTSQAGPGWIFPYRNKIFLIDFGNETESPEFEPLSNLYVHEVDQDLTEAKFLGMLLHHTVAGEENARINDPCLLVEHGVAYLFVNVGRRLNQEIGLATAQLW